MAWTVTEKGPGRAVTTGGSPTAEFLYDVAGTPVGSDPEDEVIAAAVAAAPATYRGLYVQSKRLRTLLASHAGGFGRYEVAVIYGALSGQSEPPAGVGSPTWEWRRGGTTQRITHAISTTKYPSSAPDLQGAINVTSKGTEGLDVEVTEFSWTEKHVFERSSFGFAECAAIAALKKSVNDAPFRGGLAGEVFFDDFAARPRNEEEVECDFDFRASPNRTVALGNAITIGTITDIEKGGWDYVWVKTFKVEVGGLKLELPQGVYVNKIYEDADFSSLGIGTAVLT